MAPATPACTGSWICRQTVTMVPTVTASFRESSLVSTFIFASVFRPRLERRAEIGRGKDAQFMDGGQRKPRRWSRLRGEAVRQHHAAGQRRGSRGGQGSSL